MRPDPQAALRLAMQAAREGRPTEALNQLRSMARADDPFPRQNQYTRLVKALAPQLGAWPTLRVALLSGSTVDPLADLLSVWLLLAGFRLEVYVAPFDSWQQQAMDASSGLYAFEPDFIWFTLTARDLRVDETLATNDDPEAVAALLRPVVNAVEQVSARCHATVLVNNAEASVARVLGNLEGGHAASRAAQLRHYNLELPRALPPGCVVFDLAHQAACFGLQRWEDARLWFHSKHPFALDAFGPVAFAAARLLAAGRGRSRKCIVLDLDHTLWGGVVGDDGPEGIRLGTSGGAAGEAFVAFQSYLKALSSRGIALAVCSKNDDTLAREPFALRPEMVLGLEDIAVFQANWSNKADNIRLIASTLNIGLDALVFVDDNPAERALVRAELPDVAVVDLPDDPSGYIAALAAGGWFETLALSAEDRGRARAYRDNAVRAQAQAGSADLGAYLRSLDMHATWATADAPQLPRMAQLLNKTNQFQLTDKRYAEAELATMAADPGWWVARFSLRDRFGEHGLISVVVIRLGAGTAHIEAWAMSCRVFSRGMEDFIFHVLRREMARRGLTRLVGRHVASSKNGVVAKLYARLGGEPAENTSGPCWAFDLQTPTAPGEFFIHESGHEYGPGATDTVIPNRANKA